MNRILLVLMAVGLSYSSAYGEADKVDDEELLRLTKQVELLQAENKQLREENVSLGAQVKQFGGEVRDLARDVAQQAGEDIAGDEVANGTQIMKQVYNKVMKVGGTLSRTNPNAPMEVEQIVTEALAGRPTVLNVKIQTLRQERYTDWRTRTMIKTPKYLLRGISKQKVQVKVPFDKDEWLNSLPPGARNDYLQAKSSESTRTTNTGGKRTEVTQTAKHKQQRMIERAKKSYRKYVQYPFYTVALYGEGVDKIPSLAKSGRVNIVGILEKVEVIYGITTAAPGDPEPSKPKIADDVVPRPRLLLWMRHVPGAVSALEAKNK